MKKIWIVFMFLLLSAANTYAQNAKMQYDAPKDIRVIIGNYFVYMTLGDIKEAFMQLPQPVQQKYAELMDVPNGVKATINIIQGSKAQASIMEPVVQRHVGGYLLKQGMAYIETKDEKKVTELEVKEGAAFTDDAGFEVRQITFYDPKTKKTVFTGTINNTFK
ncbi:hypothetical protein CAP35_14380 [Chitinophagaceae bacterium IBVUCB1]|nr:hypothetical protein CAP35_14380 [Chitinophagaceae bacterium IBVUCB1]